MPNVKFDKQKLINLSILFGILALLLAVLILLVVLPRPYTNKKIASSMQYVMDQKNPGQYKILQRIYPKSVLSNNIYIFKMKDYSDNEYCVMSQVIGMSGTAVLVFCTQQGQLEFCGISGIENSQEELIQYGISQNILDYQKSQIAKIFQGELE